MKKGFIALIVVGAVLLTAGATVFGLAIAKKAFDGTGNLVTKNHEFDDSISKINIDIDTADLTFVSTSESKTKVTCLEKEKIHHDVKVNGGTLSITTVDETRWYERWFNFVDKMKITVYLPEDTYQELKIKDSTGDIVSKDAFTFTDVSVNASTGNINFSNLTSSGINIDVSTGNINLKDVNMDGKLYAKASTGSINLENVVTTGNIEVKTSTGSQKYHGVRCADCSLKASTGGLILEDLIASGDLKIETSTGDVTFKGSDANTINVKTDTGDVKGTILTPKSFYFETDTGKTNEKDLREYTGPRCDIKTDTGDIYITVAP